MSRSWFGIASGLSAITVGLSFLSLAAENGVAQKADPKKAVISQPAGAETDRKRLLIQVTESRPAAVNVCGRVLTKAGQGVPKARLAITGGLLSTPVEVSSNPFGYFCFRDMYVGQSYSVSATSKRHLFDEAIQFFVLLDEINDMEFVALP